MFQILSWCLSPFSPMLVGRQQIVYLQRRRTCGPILCCGESEVLCVSPGDRRSLCSSLDHWYFMLWFGLRNVVLCAFLFSIFPRVLEQEGKMSPDRM